MRGLRLHWTCQKSRAGIGPVGFVLEGEPGELLFEPEAEGGRLDMLHRFQLQDP